MKEIVFYDTTLSLKKNILGLCLLMGMVFSATWVSVNVSSKYWQENWEHHTEYLTKILYGDLFGVIKKQGKYKLYSVSKLNIFISSLVTCLWAVNYYKYLTMLSGYVEYSLNIISGLVIIYALVFAKSKSKYKTESEWYINKQDKQDKFFKKILKYVKAKINKFLDYLINKL